MTMGLMELMGAGWLSKSIAVAARLGIADKLDNGPLTPAELATATQSHPDALLRLLRLLAACGIFERTQDHRFKNSPLSNQLRSNDEMSLRHFCILAGEEYYDGWGGLLHTIQTGESAFPQIFGGSIYEYMQKNSDAAGVYDNAMQDLARPVGLLLAQNNDFSSARQVVDVGGGAGMLLKQILSVHKHLQGICVDREDVCTRSEEGLQQTKYSDLSARLKFCSGNFFETVPAGGDIYLLKNVLHNWNEESCLSILQTIREAMGNTESTATGNQPRLLVIEPLIERDDTSPRNLMDALFQMVICQEGTRERSQAELQAMLTKADLEVTAIQMLSTGHGVLTCIRHPCKNDQY